MLPGRRPGRAGGRGRGGNGVTAAAASGPSSGGASSSCATSIAASPFSSTLLSFSSSVILLPRGSAAARAAPGILPLCIASGDLKLFSRPGYRVQAATAGMAQHTNYQFAARIRSRKLTIRSTLPLAGSGACSSRIPTGACQRARARRDSNPRPPAVPDRSLPVHRRPVQYPVYATGPRRRGK